MVKKSTNVFLKDTAEGLLSLLNLTGDIAVSEDAENESLVVNIQSTDDAGLLIGNRGKTLMSIQTILSIIYGNKEGEWKRIEVNVNDWREKENNRLINLAKQTAERAKTTGVPQSLYNLTASQRRIVHMTLAEDNEVVTESQGEGKSRFLTISPKSSK